MDGMTGHGLSAKHIFEQITLFFLDREQRKESQHELGEKIVAGTQLVVLEEREVNGLDL